MPSEKGFEDLIDSMVNKIDDNISEVPGGKHEDNENADVDTEGWVTSRGRLGNYAYGKTIPADGEWHAITPWLNFCQAFEIVARTGVKNTGKHAVMHAVAVSAFGNSQSNIRASRSSIKETRSWYDFWRPVKLQLKWVGTTYKYKLAMRCKQNLGAGVPIIYYITQLWSDEKMGIPSQYLDIEN